MERTPKLQKYVTAVIGSMARSTLVAALVVSFCFVATATRAQTLLRDAEIEYALRRLAAPMIRAAGLSPSRIRILILQDSSLNAFVLDSRHIFLHSGLILKLKSAEELQAVIAHEIAHIANGHITRRIANKNAATSAAALGALLSVALAAAGEGKAAAGLAIGTGSSAKRRFFAHTRAEEASADQSGIRYMVSAGVDPSAMLEVLEIFRGQEVLSSHRQDPYARSHPLTRDRIRGLTGYAAAYKGRGKKQPDTQYWYARARGKLEAFIRNPAYTLRRVKKGDSSDIALMRRAVAYHRTPNPSKALKEITALVAQRQKDPFVHELKGQILLESRQFGAAVTAYGRAVKLAPKNSLILAGYGRAILASGQSPKKALSVLEQARARDFRDPRMLRDLAVAYAKTGNKGMASLSTAERYAVIGRLSDAAIHAKRASGLLPRGSTGWNRAQDILHASETQKKRRKRG